MRFPLRFILLLSIFGLNIQAQTDPAPSSQAQTTQPPTTHTSKPARRKTAARKKSPARLSRMRQAFVASASLKPMARQLLQNRSSAAYAGVEGFARSHAATDAGSLAWLVVGYARMLDHDYAGAIEPLNRAKLHAGDLGDYVGFYLGTAYFESGHAPEAVTALAGFEKNFPASLMIRDAYVLEANALLADGRAQDAVARLEANRLPTRSDLELVLARAYEAADQQEKAVVVFRNLYFNFPLSPEASSSGIELAKLPAVASLPAPTFVDRRNRADLLLKGKRYSEAANAYRELIATASPSDQPQLILTLSEALRKAGQRHEASQVLSTLGTPTPDIAAQRLFELGEIARAGDDDDGFLSDMAQLRQTAPTSPWLEQALLSAGNIYLLRKDYDHAIDCYRELQARFPAAARASYAHWKVAWLSLRQKRNAEAKKDFEDQIALYPDSAEIPASLYWRGRLAEEDQDPATARAYYIKTSQRFRNFYYGELSRQRLAKLAPPAGGDVHLALLDHISPLNSAPKAADAAPEDNLRVQKAHLLENGALLDFAVRELKAAAQQDPGNWLAPEIARMYQDAGRYDLAIQTLKRAEPNYFAVDIPSLPRAYWEALFPKAYWADLKQFSEANNLDPYLVASLIRQESEFNPNAVSKKDAVGLMQLLPRVGKKVAKEEKLKHYTDGQLFIPGVNMQVGTRYFREMVDQFGAVEYALAAYNAGSDRVVDWQAQPKYRDVQEFVESIPFTETREYVEAIVRNANVYRQLYGAP